MQTHVKALVVGGGAVGTSIAYHLLRPGGRMLCFWKGMS